MLLKWASSVQHGQVQMYLIFCLSEYLKILIRYRLPRKVSKIKIKILRPLYLLYLLLQYLRYSPTQFKILLSQDLRRHSGSSLHPNAIPQQRRASSVGEKGGGGAGSNLLTVPNQEWKPMPHFLPLYHAASRISGWNL